MFRMESSKQHNRNKKREGKRLWQFPWKYRESFLIALEFLILGLVMQILSRGKEISPPSWPANLVLLLCMIAVLMLVYSSYRRTHLIRWISGIPAAISSIVLYFILILLLGFVPQNVLPEDQSGFLNVTGLSHITRSWPFVISTLYILAVLGFVVIRRSIPLRKKNIGFLINHAGLWIIIAAGSLGTGDLKQLVLPVEEKGGFVHHAFDMDEEAHLLSFSIKLIDFDIDEYNPKLAIIDPHTGELIEGKGQLVMAEEGLGTVIADWEITVNEILASACPGNGSYIPDDSTGSAPAVHVSAVHRRSGMSAQGWVFSGSSVYRPGRLILGRRHVLAITRPEAKEYKSHVVIRKAHGDSSRAIISVNKPLKVHGWKIYQLSYDQQEGRHSGISILELVKDPWLPVVYAGIFMLLGGALYLFWMGTKAREKGTVTKTNRKT